MCVHISKIRGTVAAYYSAFAARKRYQIKTCLFDAADAAPACARRTLYYQRACHALEHRGIEPVHSKLQRLSNGVFFHPVAAENERENVIFDLFNFVPVIQLVEGRTYKR